MKSSVVNVLLLLLAVFSMGVALTFQTVSVAGPLSSYKTVLLIALGAMLLADVVCIYVIARDGAARLLALLIATPSLFIIWDFLRRAPYVWGLV